MLAYAIVWVSVRHDQFTRSTSAISAIVLAVRSASQSSGVLTCSLRVCSLSLVRWRYAALAMLSVGVFMAHEYKNLGCSPYIVQPYQVLLEIHYLDSSSNYRECLPQPPDIHRKAVDGFCVLDTCGRLRTHDLCELSKWIVGAILLFGSIICGLYSAVA